MLLTIFATLAGLTALCLLWASARVPGPEDDHDARAAHRQRVNALARASRTKG